MSTQPMLLRKCLTDDTIEDLYHDYCTEGSNCNQLVVSLETVVRVVWDIVSDNQTDGFLLVALRAAARIVIFPDDVSFFGAALMLTLRIVLLYMAGY